MKGKILSLLAGAALLGSVGAASAAEPVTLTDAQLANVTAGAFNIGFGFGAVQTGIVPTAVLNFGTGVDE